MADIKTATNWAEDFRRGYLQELGNDVIENLGRYDGKYGSGNVSLASHTINATLVGLNTYLYEELVVRGNDQIDEDEIRVLTSALTLHDVNKIVSHTQDKEYDENTREVLEKYFEEDILGVGDYLPGSDSVDKYFDDLLYLIQRTETGESGVETRGLDTEFSGLESYCEIGDSVASACTSDGIEQGYSKLERMFSHLDETHAHLLSFSQTNRPILGGLALETVKEVLSGGHGLDPCGVVVGSTSDAVLYLGKSVERDSLRDQVQQGMAQKVSGNRFDVGCKANWQSVDYGALEYIGSPVDEKREVIVEEYRGTLEEGKAGINPIESIPESVEEVLPEILHRMYVEKDYEFESEKLQSLYDEISDDVFGSKVKVHFIAKLCEEIDKYESELDSLVQDYEEKLKNQLTPEESPSEEVVSQFFGDVRQSELFSKGNGCFYCGGSADSEYKGNTLYGTNAFSKRVKSEQKYKNICRSCWLEESLLSSVVGEIDQSDDDIAMVFFYYDDFVADATVGGSTDFEKTNVLEETIDFGESESGLGAIELTYPQVHIQPVSLSTSFPGHSKQDRKLRIVRKILMKIQETGMKATITTPLRPFKSERPVFRDLNPVPRQRRLGLHHLENYEDIEQALSLLKIGHEFNGATEKNSPYLELEEDSFVSIVHSAVRNFDDVTGRKSVKQYCQNYQTESYMEMKQVAEHGFELYRTSFNDSKHKKTAVFREAIEAVMIGLRREMDRSTLEEFVGGRVMTASNRQQDGSFTVDSKDVEEFVTALLDYLEENDFLELQQLSDGENHITDAYYFAYEQVLTDYYNSGDNNDND